jgi:CMP-N-acetylneuraminic acid synthetase
MNKTIAIIPARGGSKGIPHKNICLLAGKPLIAHTIETALAAKSINRVIVSTDDPLVGSVSKQCGVEVVWRPADICGDSASSESALLHVLSHFEQLEGYNPDLVVFLQCTSPLTTPEDIDGTVQALIDEEADTALTVAPFHYFLWKQNTKGTAIGINHNKYYRQIRQELNSQFIETGAVYVMRCDGFKRDRHRFFGKTTTYIMPQERCLEIDEVIDFRIAEMLLTQRWEDERNGSH